VTKLLLNVDKTYWNIPKTRHNELQRAAQPEFRCRGVLDAVREYLEWYYSHLYNYFNLSRRGTPINLILLMIVVSAPPTLPGMKIVTEEHTANLTMFVLIKTDPAASSFVFSAAEGFNSTSCVGVAVSALEKSMFG
jgi:hypothetical protein